MNPVAPLDPWPVLTRWLLHGEGAQLSDVELIERLRWPEGIERLTKELMGTAADATA